MGYLKRHRVDHLQKEARAVLDELGVGFVDTSGAGHGCPDGFAWDRATGWIALEFKRAKGGVLTPAQETLHRRFPVVVIESLFQLRALFGVRM